MSEPTQNRTDAFDPSDDGLEAGLAAAGKGADAATLTETERLRWRRQALTWLRADLPALAGVLAKQPKARPGVAQTLRHWQTDADLASLRGPQALQQLAPEERAACARLWADVAALLKVAEKLK